MTTDNTDVFTPSPSPDSEAFWQGMSEHELRIPYCTACDRYFFPPMPGCPLCSADADRVESRKVSGRGTIYSWIVAHLAFDPAFADEVPYAIATVELEEGPRINGRLRNIDFDAITAGMKVGADFEDRSSHTMLCFSPVES